MALISRALSFCACLMAASLQSVSSLADQPGDFDFYVLALSWSPTYCKQEGEDANPHQCDVRNPFRFVVHGLWPQYENGYPSSCPGVRQRIDRKIAVEMEDIMPSHGLVFHQWRKHGTCSGLEPEDYFGLTREAYEKITIPGAFEKLNKRGKAAPATVEKAFRLANPGLKEDGMAVTCSRGEFEEIRICLTKDLAFRSCAAVDRRGCRSGNLSVPAPR
ncbi:ribonuclease T [uncultured Roseibium sp.]|uniref:ribonuclease T2 family protein n=1 Tax=uncultured Roseibium sp. TaxID=1936171 RepID=UPI002613259A|nr:ribonuclease T [uncultured Roseibium sp.]